MALIQRVPWTVQPQVAAQINPASWQARSLALWYPLNGYSNDPTKNTFGALNNGAKFSPSQRGIAAFFDGVDDYISWPSTTLGNGNNFTFSAWIYYSGALGSRATVYGCENATTTFQLEVGGGSGGATSGGISAIYNGSLVGSTGNGVLSGSVWTHIAYIKRGTGATSEFYVNGIQTTAVSNNAIDFTETASVHTLGRRVAASQLFSGMIQDVRINNFAMSAAQVAELYRNGLQLFAPLPRRIWAPAGAGSGSTGTVAYTNANDSGNAAGTTTVVGTLAKTNANDTLAASGSAGSSVSGTLAYTNANDTSAASGTTTVTGTVARTNSNDTAAASGWAGSVSGSLAVTNGDDTLSASGVVTPPVSPFTGGGWASLKTRKRIYRDEEPPEPVAEVVEVVPPKPPKRKTLTLEQLIGATAAEMLGPQQADAMAQAVEVSRKRRRQREEEILLLM